jgi:hypothetical protein
MKARVRVVEAGAALKLSARRYAPTVAGEAA